MNFSASEGAGGMRRQEYFVQVHKGYKSKPDCAQMAVQNILTGFALAVLHVMLLEQKLAAVCAVPLMDVVFSGD